MDGRVWTKKNLDFIDFAELTCVYEDLDEFQTKYICNDSMSSESEFSDFSLNWMQYLVTTMFWSEKSNMPIDKDGNYEKAYNIYNLHYNFKRTIC